MSSSNRMGRCGFVFLILSLISAGVLADSSAEIEPDRRDELVHLLHQDCGSCHGMTLKGGLGPSLLPADLAGKPASYIREVIANGVPEKAMPPWKNILQPREIDLQTSSNNPALEPNR